MTKYCENNNYLSRRFGVELEYNAFDKLSRSIGQNDLPMGIYFYAEEIRKKLKCFVDVTKWHYTNGNENWVLKPDASCGLEVCSPVVSGNEGLITIYEAVEALAASKKTSSDERCSLHVHVEIEDYEIRDIVNLFRYWVKNELFFYMLTSPKRWLNSYCQPIGFSYPVETLEKVKFQDIFDLLGSYKYFAINLFHYKKGKRKTVEFRIMGNKACLDPLEAQIWCRLLLCFVHRVRERNFDTFENQTLYYAKPKETLRFLNLPEFTQNQELVMWIIEKFSYLIDNKTLFDKNFSKRYIWEEIISNSQEDFTSAINFLEGILC